MPIDRIPTLGDLNAYDVNRVGAVEVTRQSLYDFQVYPTAGATLLTFFALPQGQGVSASPGFVGTKQLSDTNMTTAGTLPSPQAHISESLEVHFQAGSVSTANTFTLLSPVEFAAAAAATVDAGVADVNAVLSGGLLRWLIGSKDYLQEAPLYRFPPKAYIGINPAVATNSATVGMATVALARAMGRAYYLEPPLTLRATQNFSGILQWPAAIPTPSGFNARIGIVADGYLFRNAQ